MQKLLLILVGLGACAAPAFAQATPPAAQPAPSQGTQQTPEPVTKLVCRQVEEEPLPGSRVARKSQVCRKVEVPAPTNAKAAQPQDGGGHGG